MRTVLLASLRTHLRRYVAAAVAVVVGVAFVVVVGVLTAGARAGLMDGFGAPYRGADHVVVADPGVRPPRGPSCCPDTLDVAAAIALVDRLGDDASGLGRVLLPMQVGDERGSTTVGPIAASEELRWQELTAGRFPAGDGEAVVHVWDATALDIAVGDRIRVGADATELAVVGLVNSPSTESQASVYVAWAQYLHWREHPLFHIGKIAVRGDVGPVPEGAVARTAEEHVTEGLAGLSNDTDAYALMGVLFAAVALVVAGLVVANTFAILFAQRMRDFALLRCVGATRRQVLGSVRREALAVGALASLIGVPVGGGLGYGLIALVNAVAPTTPMGVPGLPVPWLLAGFAVGTLVTAVASWLPTRGVVRVSPLAALRPESAVDARTATGRSRLALAASGLVVGTVLLGVAIARRDTMVMVAGGAAFFGGVLLLGPVVVPRMVRVAGALLGPAGRLATENAVRNPRRTATTTAALLIGVTLTTAVLTGLATYGAALDETTNRNHPVDVALGSTAAPLPADLLDQVRGTTGVERAIAVHGAVARVDGLAHPIPVVSAPDAAHVARDGGGFARVEPGTIRLDLGSFRDLGIEPGDRVAVRVGDRRVELRVISLSGWGNAGLVAPEDLARLVDTPEPRAVWVRTAPDADPLRLVDDLTGLAAGAGAGVEDQLQARAVQQRELDVLTWSVLGLLGVSVAIALVGIGNTLGLSVLERAREHAMLRALGLTRRQLRRMLAAEAALMAVVATLLGTTIGVAFAWVTHETLIKQALTRATLQIPWPSLGAVVLVAALAGVLASVVPARRAARVTPAAGLTHD
ncbi:FtsX-like permease family protein [Pseudonocardia lacus]|uniref:FtsX-like permease family protein n=1 Tax=Pseudonocardia lacus TaxID=2835865 RepID=UPI001BDC66EE|nr:FtsX-like permease family protein [Pseudonocardia lacus]